MSLEHGISWILSVFKIEEGVPHVSDLNLAICATIIYCIARYFCELILRPLGYALGTKDPIDNHKFTEQSVKFTHHSIATAYGLWYMMQQSWFHDIHTCYDDYHHQVVSVSFKVYYLIQIGFHTMSLIYHFFEQARTDFAAMLAHHIATVILVFVSYSNNWTRIGALIFLVHDFSDVFGCALKISVYLRLTPAREILFFLLMICWAVTRMYIFPMYLINAAAFDHWALPLEQQGGHIHTFIIACLVLLVCLHYYWFFLFLKIAKGIVMKGGEEAAQIYEKKKKQLKKNNEVKEKHL